jgi:N-acetylmuramoyl-L-alanine amidase
VLRAGAAVATGLALGPHLTAAQGAEPGFDADVGLDPGHSRVDVGASGAGVGEFQHTLDVAFRIKPLLEAAGLRVNLSRTDHGPVSEMSHRDPTERTRIEQQARIAAVGRASVYVSVHFNALGDRRVGGTETYYNADNFGTESRRLAGVLQAGVVAAIREYGYPTSDRGVMEDLRAGKPYGHFFSLRGEMPSALVEGLFLSNPNEAALLTDDGLREAIARGYVGGILEYFAGSGSPFETP